MLVFAPLKTFLLQLHRPPFVVLFLNKNGGKKFFVKKKIKVEGGLVKDHFFPIFRHPSLPTGAKLIASAIIPPLKYSAYFTAAVGAVSAFCRVLSPA